MNYFCLFPSDCLSFHSGDWILTESRPEKITPIAVFSRDAFVFRLSPRYMLLQHSLSRGIQGKPQKCMLFWRARITFSAYNKSIHCCPRLVFFFSIYFYSLEANYFTILQWFLPYIDMNQPRIYMCSPSRSPLPPPSPSHPSGPSQCTSPEHPSHASNLGW